MEPYEDQIQQIYPSLSKGERKVADYVRENMSAVLRMTIRELKDAVGVSEPTVFRFCQAMGYSIMNTSFTRMPKTTQPSFRR